MRRGHIFSIGGEIARVWRPKPALLPWALSSALLVTVAMWDHWTTGGQPDLVVMGLAAYELMLGLIDTAPLNVTRTHPWSPRLRERAPGSHQRPKVGDEGATPTAS